MNQQQPKPDYFQPYYHLIKELVCKNKHCFGHTVVKFINGYSMAIMQSMPSSTNELYAVTPFDGNGLKAISLLDLADRGATKFYRESVLRILKKLGEME